MITEDKPYSPNKSFKTLMTSILIIFGIYIMLFPILKITSMSGFFFGISLFLLIPSILYSIITIKVKEIEFLMLPALFLLIAEYYFFHNFSTWIASDANAAIGLIIIPIYLILVLGISYGASFVILKIRKKQKL